MKRFHVHLHVADLAQSIGFYSKLFGQQPSRQEADYAKWMLEDPAVNFAISQRGAEPGIDHLGFQTDDASELAALKQRAASGARLASRDYRAQVARRAIARGKQPYDPQAADFVRGLFRVRR